MVSRLPFEDDTKYVLPVDRVRAYNKLAVFIVRSYQALCLKEEDYHKKPQMLIIC